MPPSSRRTASRLDSAGVLPAVKDSGGAKARGSVAVLAEAAERRLRCQAPSSPGQAASPKARPGVGREKDRRIEIIRRAAPILMKEGFKGISMNELARLLNMTKPGLYYHFRGKQELLYAIMGFTMDWTESMALAATVSTSDNVGRLREIVYRHALGVAAHEKKGALTTLVIDDVNALKPEDRRVITERKRAYFQLVRATVTQLQKEGRLRQGLDATVATFTILGMVMWITKWYEPSGRLAAEAVAQQVADMALGALLVPPGRRGPQAGGSLPISGRAE